MYTDKKKEQGKKIIFTKSQFSTKTTICENYYNIFIYMYNLVA